MAHEAAQDEAVVLRLNLEADAVAAESRGGDHLGRYGEIWGRYAEICGGGDHLGAGAAEGDEDAAAGVGVHLDDPLADLERLHRRVGAVPPLL